jgi:hypothetical protein
MIGSWQSQDRLDGIKVREHSFCDTDCTHHTAVSIVAFGSGKSSEVHVVLAPGV